MQESDPQVDKTLDYYLCLIVVSHNKECDPFAYIRRLVWSPLSSGAKKRFPIHNFLSIAKQFKDIVRCCSRVDGSSSSSTYLASYETRKCRP